MFVAGRQINVERDGKLVALIPGDPVPEAATWPHAVLVNCMKVGQIVNVEKASPKALAEAQASETAARTRSVAAKNAGQSDGAQPKAKSTSKMPKAPSLPSTSKANKKTAAA